MQSILGNEIDAILGVGCLKSLERAFEKLLIAGIPAMAVPLDTGECKDSQVEIEAVFRMIETPYIPPDEHTVDRAHSVTTGPPPSMLHLLRGTARLFESPAIEHLLPRKRVRETGASDASSAIGTVESLGFEFLVRGGKYYRPFIMLAVYDALTGSGGTLPDGANVVDGFPDHVKRTAMAIEIFHKASLIHDDIEDDDPFRYGAPALHTSHGIPAAINTGDYLLGLGYRLIAEQRHRLGASAVEILAELSGAHTRLTEGQGMELYWKSQPATELERLSSSEVLKIYALKTAPDFEAALQIGVHLAATTMSVHATGPDRQDGQDRASVLSGLTASAGRGVPSAVSSDVSVYGSRLVKYSRHLGVGFQIRNDLDDWDVEPGNKRLAGRDLVDRRPTLLLAIALERLESEERGRLVRALGNADRIGEIRELYERADVFATARSLIGRHAVRSHEIAAECGDGPFRELLDHFVEALLE